MIEGKRVALRSLEREDIDTVHRWFNDSEFMRLDRFAPEHMVSKEELERKYEKYLRGEEKNWKMYMIVEKSSGDILGAASFRYWGEKPVTASIGIGIPKKGKRGKGYGEEAMRMLLDIIFKHRGFHRAELMTLATNDQAIKCFKKCGFREEGISREAVYFDGKYHDLILMGLLKEEYMSRSANRPSV